MKEPATIINLKPTERLLPRSDVIARTGFKTSMIYKMMAEGRFPRPIHIGTSVRWLESDIDAWIAEQVAAAGRGTPDRAAA